MIQQFLRFLGVGGLATGLMVLLLVGLVEFAGVKPTPASAAAYLISAVFNYWANYHWTFNSSRRHHSAILRFSAIAAGGLILNTAIMFAMTEWLAFYYVVSQVAASILVLLWNFLANRRWTFQPPQESAP
jgi:putative flippase GtrA